MKRFPLAAFFAALFAASAWAQVPPGVYVFVSGPGVGTPPFTVTGFTTSLGGSIGGIHLPNCSGIHVHGTFNGFADPNSGGCGHGIIAMLVAPPPVSGGGLPGGMPSNIAGQLALTTPSSPAGQPLSLAGDAFLLSLSSFAYQENAGLGDRAAMGGLFVALATPADAGLPRFSMIQGAAGAPGTVVRTTLADPAQRILSNPAATSWLDDFAVLKDREAAGHGQEADRVKRQADEWQKLADDARRDAEINRQRAEDARKEGRGNDGRDWDAEAQRDEDRAAEREAEARRLEGQSEQQRQREATAKEEARQRRADAEREREKARQAERDRTERARQQAEEKARIAREERDARRAKEQAEREAKRQAQEDKERAREREIARQRAAAEREHRQRLAEEQAKRDARARGSSSDADLAAAAARDKKKKEEEETSALDAFADYLVALYEGKSETRAEQVGQLLKDQLEEKIADKLKEKGMKATGLDKLKEQLSEQLTDKLDELGLDSAAGKLTDGLSEIQKIKEIGEWIDSELAKNEMRQRRQMDKIDAITDGRNTEVLRGASSGTIAGKDVIDVYKGAIQVLNK